MKNRVILYCFFLSVFLFWSGNAFSQTAPEAGDPPNSVNVPDFYVSKLPDIEAELAAVKVGKVEKIATSPGGLPVYAVYYGKKDNFQSQANYNSAVGAGDPAFYARKAKDTKPVVFFLGPVHGQEVEGMAGLINLIHIAETGKDLRGKEWAGLKSNLDRCRVIIIPCGNPDGRKRCPYDSFVGLPGETMTKYGQGTHKDGTLWRWPQVKSLHPLKGDVGILGAYFNDDGINIMHDDFFFPMAEETKAILKIARDETPDMTVSLHSHNYPPCILQPAHQPLFMKERVAVLANRLNEHYKSLGLPYMTNGWQLKASVDDEKFPPRSSFNLVSALHHISGTMSFTFECCHGDYR
ncbi:MAG: M14 family zinc carboxypeptidase [Mangrovibacterium sp.]